MKKQRMLGALAQKRFHSWDNRAKQRLEKSGLNVNKKCGATRATASYINKRTQPVGKMNRSFAQLLSGYVTGQGDRVYPGNAHR